MNKKFSITALATSLTLALAIIFGSTMSVPTMALAAEAEQTIAEATEIQPRRTVFYPTSGMSSGSFDGLKSSIAVFSLPANSNYHISYCYDAADDSSGTLVIKKRGSNSSSAEIFLHGDGRAYTSNAFSLSAGTYEVYILSTRVSTHKSYGYDIYYD